jgi:hypothetical protein
LVARGSRSRAGRRRKGIAGIRLPVAEFIQHLHYAFHPMCASK